jgi:membrane-associated protease RseP (regulator of RpoE activity)
MPTNRRLRSGAVPLLIFGGLVIVGGMLAVAQVTGPQPTRDRGGAPAAQKQNVTNPTAQPTDPAAQQRRPGSDETRAPAANTPAARAEPPANRTAQRQGLGIQFDQQTQNGLTVANVQQSSVAAQAGLQQGDRILAVDGQSFNSQRQLQAYLGGQYGRRVPVIIDRGGRQYTIQLSLTEQQGDGAWLGVYLNDNQENERGAIVAQVYPSGPAARAGLQSGDVIQQVNGQPVATSADLIATIEEMQPGAKAELSVLRNNEPTQITASLGNRDSFVFRGQNHDRNDYGGGRGNDYSENDDYNIPLHALELEHNRRNAEQHQRIETEIAKLRDEVRQLREALQRR